MKPRKQKQVRYLWVPASRLGCLKCREMRLSWGCPWPAPLHAQKGWGHQRDTFGGFCMEYAAVPRKYYRLVTSWLSHFYSGQQLVPSLWEQIFYCGQNEASAKKALKPGYGMGSRHCVMETKCGGQCLPFFSPFESHQCTEAETTAVGDSTILCYCACLCAYVCVCACIHVSVLCVFLDTCVLHMCAYTHCVTVSVCVAWYIHVWYVYIRMHTNSHAFISVCICACIFCYKVNPIIPFHR